MGGQTPITEPSLLAYKKRRRRGKMKELEELLVELLVKSLVFLLLSANSSVFIAAPQTRGADHSVGSNSIPTTIACYFIFITIKYYVAIILFYCLPHLWIKKSNLVKSTTKKGHGPQTFFLKLYFSKGEFQNKANFYATS